MPDRASYPKCFGPYLRYGILTEFADFEFFDERENFRLFLLSEFKRDKPQDEFIRRLNHALSGPHQDSSSPSVEVGPAKDSIPFATLRAPTAAVTPIAPDDEVFKLWEDYVSRVELSLPLKLSVPPPSDNMRKIIDRSQDGSAAALLIGMMDDGCPFAAARFQKASGGTRVRGIWDQNRDRQPVQVGTDFFGQEVTDFGYGLEYRRDTSGNQIGLNDWISKHSTAGLIDEDGCYAHAGFKRLASQQSHGAHVMDLLAGQTPLSSRIGPSSDRRDPPSWTGTDPASSADVVFVQFSDDCIRDATGVWLKAYVVDGIRYIMSFADPAVTTNVIINLSYGPTTGPHDGTAELETALSELVAEYNGSPNQPKLDIFLPAGNAYLSKEHVVFTADPQHNQVEWTWRLPPDNTVLCFAEVWTNDVPGAGNISVTLTSPSGYQSSSSSVVSTTLPTPGGTIPQLIGPVVWGNDRMWLLEVGPTVAKPGVYANEHGDWKIKVSSVDPGVQIDAYVARTDPNMGVTTGAKRSFFIDSVWEHSQSATASSTFVDGEFDNTGSLVSRFGTLNGIATGYDSAVHVAGGYVLLDGHRSSYSSAGPSRRYPTTSPRVGPDYLLPCDESYALSGILAGGTRSGSVFRLIGTSNAAPELARLFIKYIGAALPAPTHVPTTLPEREKRGAGDLPPP
jgi:hypothetical protein